MMQCHRAPHRLGDGTLALWVLLDAGVRGLPGLHQERGCGCRAAQRAMHQCCTHAARTRPLHAHASHTPPAVQLSTLQHFGGALLDGTQIYESPIVTLTTPPVSGGKVVAHLQRAAQRYGRECSPPASAPPPPQLAYSCSASTGAPSCCCSSTCKPAGSAAPSPCRPVERRGGGRGQRLRLQLPSRLPSPGCPQRVHAPRCPTRRVVAALRAGGRGGGLVV